MVHFISYFTQDLNPDELKIIKTVLSLTEIRQDNKTSNSLKAKKEFTRPVLRGIKWAVCWGWTMKLDVHVSKDGRTKILKLDGL